MEAQVRSFFMQDDGEQLLGFELSEDKNIFPLKVAILATFLFYRYKKKLPAFSANGQDNVIILLNTSCNTGTTRSPRR